MLNFKGKMVRLELSTYCYGQRLAITIVPYANLTVDITHEKLTNRDCGFVDITNCGEGVIQWIIDNNLGRPTHKFGYNGFGLYPEVEFNLEEIRKHG